MLLDEPTGMNKEAAQTMKRSPPEAGGELIVRGVPSW